MLKSVNVANIGDQNHADKDLRRNRRPRFGKVFADFAAKYMNMHRIFGEAPMVDSSTLQPRIRPLDQQCINRIAAGEVIHRPASAVRDPLLNSGLSMDAALTHLC